MDEFINICNECESAAYCSNLNKLRNYIFNEKITFDTSNKYHIFYLALLKLRQKKYDESFGYFKQCNLTLSYVYFGFILNGMSDLDYLEWIPKRSFEIEKYLLLGTENKTASNIAIGMIYNHLGLYFEISIIDYKRCFMYYSKSHKCGYQIGSVNLALCYKQGIGCAHNIDKFLEIMTKLINNNSPYSLIKLGNYYYHHAPDKRELGLRYIMFSYLESIKINDEIDMKNAKGCIGDNFLFDIFLKWYKLTYEKECNELRNELNKCIVVNKHLINIIVGYSVE
jgi:hypothetical protein